LSKKNISPGLFDPNRSFKRENTLSLAKELFIKVSMARRSCLVMFTYFLLQEKVLCFGPRRQAAYEMFISVKDPCGKNDYLTQIVHSNGKILIL